MGLGLKAQGLASGALSFGFKFRAQGLGIASGLASLSS